VLFRSSLKKKVREAQIQQIPLIITIGEKEKEAGTLSVRTLDGQVKYGVTMDDLIEKAFAHIRERRSSQSIM
jgi:threonyl-tRNA synthetase